MGKVMVGVGQSNKKKKKDCKPEMLTLIRGTDDIKTKRVLVREGMGEMFYCFGETLKPWKPYLTYEENMEESNENN
jgi:hypothetical protein